MFYRFILSIVFLLILSISIYSCANDDDSSRSFPVVSGWKLLENIKIYPPETLYKYINGAAELYLTFNFKELKVAEYKNEKEASIIIEVYCHNTPYDAFGIYSQERPIEGRFLNIGAQGYIEPPILNFWANNFYFKISGYALDENAGEILTSFAKQLAENFGRNAAMPAILSCFPEQGKIQNSEKFIAKNLLGHDFLYHGFIADYREGANHFQIFIIEGLDSTDCQKMLSQYFQLCQIPPTQLKQGHHIISDPYHGEIAFVWQDKYVWGVKNLNHEILRNDYLQRISSLITRHENKIHP